MESLYILIPLSALLVLLILGLFGWALHRGQFEELEVEGERMLQGEGPQHPPTLPDRAPLDARQAATTPLAEESRPGYNSNSIHVHTATGEVRWPQQP